MLIGPSEFSVLDEQFNVLDIHATRKTFENECQTIIHKDYPY